MCEGNLQPVLACMWIEALRRANATDIIGGPPALEVMTHE